MSKMPTTGKSFVMKKTNKEEGVIPRREALMIDETS